MNEAVTYQIPLPCVLYMKFCLLQSNCESGFAGQDFTVAENQVLQRKQKRQILNKKQEKVETAEGYP